jgi:hypothetical protein
MKAHFLFAGRGSVERTCRRNPLGCATLGCSRSQGLTENPQPKIRNLKDCGYITPGVSPKGRDGRDIALRCPYPRRAGGTYLRRREPRENCAALRGADGAARRPYHRAPSEMRPTAPGTARCGKTICL